MEAKQAATAILMLESAEEDVVANACDALYKFAEKCLYFLLYYVYSYMTLDSFDAFLWHQGRYDIFINLANR